MFDALVLGLAWLAAIIGMSWLALSMNNHHRQATGLPLPVKQAQTLRILGAAGLIASLGLCLAADHITMAILVWFMLLAASASSVAMTLTWRAPWLALMLGRHPASVPKLRGSVGR
ncbi:MAG TPA: DUF3325 domain-containing protein [Marinagarivorans sp.]